MSQKTFDTLIRNATIVDGTGAPAYQGHIGISGGAIVAVGATVSGDAETTIEAKGLLATPGWVDTHSHMDGQATWDPHCSPASNHGITTLVMGNCGVGFAPCKQDPEEHDRLIAVMEDVEDIPGVALHEGIAWNWETFPEYLDALDAMPRAVDIGAQVPHCAVRTYVMGERGAKNEQPTADEVNTMKAVVKEGIEAGAIGFTTSRTQLHKTRDGEVMPGTYADASELLGIGEAIGAMGKGIYGLVSDFDNWQEEMEWMKKLSIDNNCQVNFVLFFREENDWPRVVEQLAYVKEAAKEGARLIPHVGARPVNILMGWDATVNPFMFHQNFGPLMALSHEERLVELRKPEVREAILAEKAPMTGDDFLDSIIHGFENLFVLGDPPQYEPNPSDNIAAKAESMGITAAAFAYDAMLENNGKNLLYYPAFGYSKGDLSRQIALLKDESTVISLADTGAHCGVLCDASTPTTLLSYMVRDRKGETLPLERAVQMHTQETAQCMGLYDRGTLEVGMKADINLIEFDKLQAKAPEIIFDLPAGGRRVFQEAIGYRYTLVSGEIIMRDGVPTDARPGKLIRGSQPAPIIDPASQAA